MTSQRDSASIVTMDWKLRPAISNVYMTIILERETGGTGYVLSRNYSRSGTSDNKTNIKVNTVNKTATEKETTKQFIFIEIRKRNLK